jgi:sialidase-1
MCAIELVDNHVVYENPHPEIRARHGYFPGLVKLPSGDLLAMFVLGEALDAANMTTVVSRSQDQGRTWVFEGPIYERKPEQKYYSDYMKPTLLQDGSLIATGYNFHRSDPDQSLANPETDGMRPGDNLISYSTDEGRSWTHPAVIPTTRRDLIEASGPTIQLRSGAILVGGSLFPMWDGGHPSGFIGVLLRSEDNGKTWDDSGCFWEDPAGRYSPSEPRFCEMQDNRLVSLVWTADHAANTFIANHVTVSHDGGATWSAPMDTGVMAQASNLTYLGGDILLTIHAHREGEVGLVVRIVDFASDKWRTVEESTIWGNAPSVRIGHYAQMAKLLRFGQPSLLLLDGDEYLATHWAVEDGQGKILTHRLRIHA